MNGTGGSRGAASRRRVPVGQATPPAVAPSEPNGGRSWSRSPWLWTGVVVLLAVGAVGLSILVGTDADKPEPGDEDHSAFCAAVEQLRRDRPAGDTVTFDGSLDPFVRVRDDFAVIVETSPDKIRKTSQELHKSSAELVEEFERLVAGGQSLDQVPEAIAVLDRFDRKNAKAASRFSYYVERACGFNPAQPSPDATTSTVPEATASTVPDATVTSDATDSLDPPSTVDTGA